MEQLTLNLNREKLFEEITSSEQLLRAFKAVKANRGAPGVDGQSVEEFAANLQEEVANLSQEVRAWRYKAKPVRRVRIPKPDGGERLLGIPCVRDRVLQYSIKMSIEPMFEEGFSESSFGFRPGRSQGRRGEARRDARTDIGGRQ
jgi:RNA-directed DNA polymerase